LDPMSLTLYTDLDPRTLPMGGYLCNLGFAATSAIFRNYRLLAYLLHATAAPW
jgi:hypothetical protein